MSESPIGDPRKGAVTTLRLDERKANTLSPVAIDEPKAGLDRAEKRAVAAMQAQVDTPEGALDAGYLDRVVPADILTGVAMREAEREAGETRGVGQRAR